MWRKNISLTYKHQSRIPVKDEHDKDLRTIYKSKKNPTEKDKQTKKYYEV